MPSITISKGSLEPGKISRKKCAETEHCCEIDATQLDLEYFAKETSPAKIDEHITYMTSDAKRNVEVSLRWLSKSDRKKFEEAQGKEMDQ